MNAITMPTCFRPYPGELLYSWIIRLYNSNGYPTVYKMYLMVCRHVFGTMKGERKMISLGERYLFHVHTFRCGHAEMVSDEEYIKKRLVLEQLISALRITLHSPVIRLVDG